MLIRPPAAFYISRRSPRPLAGPSGGLAVGGTAAGSAADAGATRAPHPMRAEPSSAGARNAGPYRRRPPPGRSRHESVDPDHSQSAPAGRGRAVPAVAAGLRRAGVAVAAEHGDGGR